MGWRLLAALETQAQEFGSERIMPETGILEPEAIQLYKKGLVAPSL